MKDEDIEVTIRFIIRPGWGWVVWLILVLTVVSLGFFGAFIAWHWQQLTQFLGL